MGGGGRVSPVERLQAAIEICEQCAEDESDIQIDPRPVMAILHDAQAGFPTYGNDRWASKVNAGALALADAILGEP